MHAFGGRCPRSARQNRPEPNAKSRDFRSKAAQLRAKIAHKQATITLKSCNDASHNLQHIKKHFSMRGALTARVPRAKTLQKPTRTRAIFMQIFVNFSRGTHRTFNIWYKSNFQDAQRLPTMIAHVLRSMCASCAPKSRRITRKIARVPIETGAISRRECP